MSITMTPKLEFNNRVVMRDTTSTDLDNKRGTLMGIASQHDNNTFWIVELDEPLADRRAIVLTDSCLQRIVFPEILSITLHGNSLE